MYAIKVKSFASHAKGGELEAIKGRSSHHHKGWGNFLKKKKEIEEAEVLIFLWLPTLKKKKSWHLLLLKETRELVIFE